MTERALSVYPALCERSSQDIITMDTSVGGGSGGKRQYSMVVDVPPHSRLWAATGEDAPVTPTKSPRKELGMSGASGDDNDEIVQQGGNREDVAGSLPARQVLSPRDGGGNREDVAGSLGGCPTSQSAVGGDW